MDLLQATREANKTIHVRIKHDDPNNPLLYDLVGKPGSDEEEDMMIMPCNHKGMNFLAHIFLNPPNNPWIYGTPARAFQAVLSNLLRREAEQIISWLKATADFQQEACISCLKHTGGWEGTDLLSFYLAFDTNWDGELHNEEIRVGTPCDSTDWIPFRGNSQTCYTNLRERFYAGENLPVPPYNNPACQCAPE